MMASVLSEYAPKGTDISKVTQMLLLHDIVEIDAGDTFLFDDKASEDKKEREEKAAERIFYLLPKNQAHELHALWNEFEDKLTLEAKFAKALDQLHPIMLNFHCNGKVWLKYSLSREQIRRKKEPAIRPVSEQLWEYAKSLLDEGVKRGWLKE